MNPAIMVAAGSVRVRNNAVLVGSLGIREILVTALGPNDDDMRLRVRGIPVFDPRFNVSWYAGEIGGIGWATFNPAWQTRGFRIARISSAMLDAIGGAFPGDLVEVDTFDGWGGSWQTSPWIARVTYEDGSTRSYAGGMSRTGDSLRPAEPPANPADYFPGYEDGSTLFSRYTVYDWDTCFFGPATVAEAGYPVDGHVTWEAIGGGDCSIVEASGNFSTLAGYTVGSIWSISWVDRQSGVIVSNVRRNSNIYNPGCGNADGTKIFGEVSAPMIPYFATGPHFFNYVPNGSFIL